MRDVGEDGAGKPPLMDGLREPRSEADWCQVSDTEWDPVLPEQVPRLLLPARPFCHMLLLGFTSQRLGCCLLCHKTPPTVFGMRVEM